MFDMNSIDYVTIALAIATHPLTGALVGAGLAAWLARDARARSAAQAFADYLEALERQAVMLAELAGYTDGLRRKAKLWHAIDYVEARLKDAGIVGDPERVTRERIVADLERIKQELFPGNARQGA